MKKIILSSFLFILLLNSNAQISIEKQPLSFSYNLKKQLKYIELPDVNNEKQRSENKNKYPLQFAKAFDVDYNPNNSGQWETMPNGDRIWRLGIVSKGAFSINFTFKNFKVPEGGDVFVYNRDKTQILGAFTALNNKVSGFLPVAPIAGEMIIIEYFEPANVKFKGILEIGRIAHDYLGIFAPTDRKLRSQSCEVNINCPEGDDWQIDKRAVMKMIVDNTDLCTGSLINNTSYDGTPYILTANHCVNNETKANKTLFIFNYESETCDGNSGSPSQTLSGSSLIATAPEEKLDFALLKLSQMPPKQYNPYFAGWNRNPEAAKRVVCIHHPDGDIKKISIAQGAPVTGNYGEDYLYNSHWHIKKWEVGATEGGSSGSPLFDENHCIVGDLTGGKASCTNPENDYFCKFDLAWDYFVPESQKLQPWLDPIESNQTILNGYDPYNVSANVDAALVEIVSPEDEYCSLQTITPAVKIRNLGNNNLTFVKINYKFDNGVEVTKEWRGDLIKNTTAHVVLDEFEILEGNHEFTVSISDVNNMVDENPDNDQMLKTFRAITGESVVLNLTTDKYGFETWWQLTDSANNVLYEGDNYLNYALISRTFCLDKGCYTFNIYDRGDDGICCRTGDGKYNLANATTNEFIGEGANFKGNDYIDFCIGSTAAKNDLSLLEVIKPENRYCTEDTIKPEILVKNLGTDTIKNFNAVYQYAGESYTYSWTGVLKQYETDTLNLDEIVMQNGETYFKVALVADGFIDENQTNNSKDFNVLTGNGEIIRMDLETDFYGEEVTWEIRSTAEEILYSGGPYRDGEIYNISETFCLDFSECYRFIVNDSAGDGICCGWTGEGNISLTNLTRNDIIYSKGDYGASVRKGFCLWTDGIEDTKCKNDIMVYPNPAKDKLTIKTKLEMGFTAKVFNISGRQLISKYCPEMSETINIEMLSTGLYLLIVESEKDRYCRKIIVE